MGNPSRDAGVQKGRAGRITVAVDFDEQANPELYAAVMAVAPGKQRALRIRSLMVKGHTFERMQLAPAPAVLRAPPASQPQPAGADDVFGPPVDD